MFNLECQKSHLTTDLVSRCRVSARTNGVHYVTAHLQLPPIIRSVVRKTPYIRARSKFNKHLRLNSLIILCDETGEVISISVNRWVAGDMATINQTNNNAKSDHSYEVFHLRLIFPTPKKLSPKKGIAVT
jgi:hypothetical protein